jgi:hypothetical protein
LACYAYHAQFLGSFADHEWSHLWEIKAKNKCKVFGWLILQNSLWAADHINKHRGQTNQIRQLYHTYPKSITHMIIKCPYAKLVWQCLQPWIGASLQPPPPTRYRQFKTWCNNMINVTSGGGWTGCNKYYTQSRTYGKSGVGGFSIMKDYRFTSFRHSSS